MNNVNLLGRLTKDPEVRWGNNGAVATFNLAIDRPPQPDGTKQADFPRITCYGKTAEFVEEWLKKGARCAIVGRIKTGSYEKNGQKVYTTDIIASRVEVIDWPDKGQQEYQPARNDNFEDSIPF